MRVEVVNSIVIPVNWDRLDARCWVCVLEGPKPHTFTFVVPLSNLTRCCGSDFCGVWCVEVIHSIVIPVNRSHFQSISRISVQKTLESCSLGCVPTSTK